MHCNFCGSDNYDIIFEYTRFIKNNILKCATCGLVYLETGQTTEELKSFYKKDYRKVDSLPKKSAEEMFYDPVTVNDCANRIKWIQSRLSSLKGQRILEIGSATGRFLDALSSLSVEEAVGIELTEDYANYAKKQGFSVHTTPVEHLNFKDEFDVVFMFHTLEHVADPLSTMRAIHKSLKAGGTFIGEVPNQNDWRIKIFDNEVIKRFHYDPFHNYYFSPETLGNYFKICGFTDIKLETVERYNSLIQLKRILCGYYSSERFGEILEQNIFSKPAEDVRIPHLQNHQETEFNRLFEKCVNNDLKGNCLRWIVHTQGGGRNSSPLQVEGLPCDSFGDLKKKIVAMVPARGGSKGLPRKNIKLLAEKPLIAYSIDAAFKSKCISEVYVSTEDEEIAVISKKYGAEVINRPPELALDTTSMLDVLKHFRDQVDFDSVVVLYPTYPLRTPEDIDNALRMYDGKTSLIGLHTPRVHPYLCVHRNPDMTFKPVVRFDVNKNYRRQAYPTIYQFCHMICIVPRDQINNINAQMYNDSSKGFEIDVTRAVDIDSEEDMVFAEFLLAEEIDAK